MVWYTVGHATLKRLLPLAASPRERSALRRLEGFEGTGNDYELALEMLRRAGHGDEADALAQDAGEIR